MAPKPKIRQTKQPRTAQAALRSERRRPLPLPLELRQLLLHRLPQPLGRAAQVDGQERPERVAELVRHDAHLVVAQVEEEARLGGGLHRSTGGRSFRRCLFFFRNTFS